MHAAEELRRLTDPAEPFPWELTDDDQRALLKRLEPAVTALSDVIHGSAQATSDEYERQRLTGSYLRLVQASAGIRLALLNRDDDLDDTPDNEPGEEPETAAQVAATEPGLEPGPAARGVIDAGPAVHDYPYPPQTAAPGSPRDGVTHSATGSPRTKPSQAPRAS